MRSQYGLVALAILLRQVVSSPQPIRRDKKACRSRQQKEKVFEAVPLSVSSAAASSSASVTQAEFLATAHGALQTSVSGTSDSSTITTIVIPNAVQSVTLEGGHGTTLLSGSTATTLVDVKSSSSIAVHHGSQTLPSQMTSALVFSSVTAQPAPLEAGTTILSSSGFFTLVKPSSSITRNAASQTQPVRVTSVLFLSSTSAVHPSRPIPSTETKAPIETSSAAAARIAPSTEVPKPRDDKFVFAHFMMGIVATYTAAAWEKDINMAKSAGISGFALNTGADPHNTAQLDFAYAAADKIGGFQLFISVDFNIYHQGEYKKVADLIQPYLGRKSQFRMDGRPFVSSFIGDGFEWDKVEAELKDKQKLFSVPFYEPKAEYAARKDISGLFSWTAWPGQVGLTLVRQDMTLDRDNTYMTELGKANKIYMAPVSPWFFTHFPPEKYDKNWLFYSELLWHTRWEQMLSLGDRLNFIEIVSWNDYGESHHIGPYVPDHATDDGSSKWNEGLDHSAMLDMAIPYITAFRAGLKDPVITRDMVVYWYRPQLKGASCGKTDSCNAPPPKGHEFVDDLVFVVVMSKNGGTLTVTSGSKPAVVLEVLPGSRPYSVPMGAGKQTFKFQAKGGEGREATDKVEIGDQCRNGVYNFNFHSGSLKF